MVGRGSEGVKNGLGAGPHIGACGMGGSVGMLGLVMAFDLDADDVDAVVFLVADGGGVMAQEAK